jgi:hypothetical protein
MRPAQVRASNWMTLPAYRRSLYAFAGNPTSPRGLPNTLPRPIPRTMAILATLAFHLFLDPVWSRFQALTHGLPPPFDNKYFGATDPRAAAQHAKCRFFGRRLLARLSEEERGRRSWRDRTPRQLHRSSPVRLSPLGLPPAPPVLGLCHPFRKGYIQHRLELLLRLFRADYAFQKEEFAPE